MKVRVVPTVIIKSQKLLTVLSNNPRQTNTLECIKGLLSRNGAEMDIDRDLNLFSKD